MPFSELLPPSNSTLKRNAITVGSNYNKTYPCKSMLLGALYQFPVSNSLIHLRKQTSQLCFLET